MFVLTQSVEGATVRIADEEFTISLNSLVVICGGQRTKLEWTGGPFSCAGPSHGKQVRQEVRLEMTAEGLAAECRAYGAACETFMAQTYDDIKTGKLPGNLCDSRGTPPSMLGTMYVNLTRRRPEVLKMSGRDAAATAILDNAGCTAADLSRMKH